AIAIHSAIANGWEQINVLIASEQFHEEIRCFLESPAAIRPAFATRSTYLFPARTRRQEGCARRGRDSDHGQPWFSDRRFRPAYRQAGRPFATPNAPGPPCCR